jgi:hypothetical protein
MKRTLALLVLLMLLGGLGAAAQDSGIGVGLILGEPTGLSAKLWLGQNTAVDAAAAWSFRDPGALHIHADYLFHKFDLLEVPQGRLPFYAGIGGRIKLETETRIGVRLAVGADYMFDSVPLDVFLEVVPLLDLVPATEFGFNAAIGVRYFLGK